ncbi:Uncharacterised protein [Mycobacteroides abscessus subsp. abscessus]|nr:Uncharacterised protein [Mycobacteroides abscessus subsp. abscessus]
MPTVAAFLTEPMPSTMVQKMTGAIIILMRLTNMVPSTPRSLPTPGAMMPTATPPATATMTATYSQCVLSRFLGGVAGISSVATAPSGCRRLRFIVLSFL